MAVMILFELNKIMEGRWVNIAPTIWHKAKNVSQTMLYAFLLMHPAFSYAGPNGGNVVGGSGSINTNGLTTTINQSSGALAINWNSFNVDINEVVNFVQPNASSIALNQILGNNASQIHGQINANGQIVLVNPNGLFFGANSTLNVGGLIASGLTINTSDFMNGDYVFNYLSDSDGSVINQGIINAASGGNVALLGKRVVNNGVISANLGNVSLAAGKAAVLTFDPQGLLGVRITDAVLQDELGVDPAVVNSGAINAASGRVLLTASQSRDVFSSAVNSNGIAQATSAVVHDDGSFTLGGGADVFNSGTIQVSTSNANQDAGQVVVLGDNVTSSGSIRADSVNGKAGSIELHAKGTTILKINSLTSATSDSQNGGSIKVLGDKVGLFDNSVVDASGELNGGEILVGGDFQGKNDRVRNASITYVGESASIKANSNRSGNGGKVIVWADKTTRFYGDIQAQGGSVNGNGGFSEVSGKESLGFAGTANLSAAQGKTGTLLLDPRNITIADGGTHVVASNDAFLDNPNGNFTFDADLITDILQGNGVSAANVVLQANDDIWVQEAITVTANPSSTSLTLSAGDDIQIDSNITLTGGALNITSSDSNCLNCNSESGIAPLGNSSTGRNIFLAADLITSGGNITLNGDNIVLAGTSNTRQISTGSGATVGNIDIIGTVINLEQTNHNSLSLNAGIGNITFNDAIGIDGNTNLGQLTIGSANVVNLNSVRAGTAGIDITASTINLTGNLRTDDDGAGNIALNGNVVLLNSIQTLTGGGNFTISGNLNADLAANNRTIVLTTGTGNVGINGVIGNAQRLGVFRVNSASDITLGTTSVSGGLNADSVNVTLANNFNTNGFGINTVQANTDGGNVTINANSGAVTVGSIVTSGGAITGNSAGQNGGNINIAAADITVGTLTTTGGAATGVLDRSGGNGGTVTLVATENAGTPSITLNGNINTTGGAAVNDAIAPAGGMVGTTGAKDIRLEGTGNANGSLTIGYTGVFTGTGLNQLTVTSNTGGSDTMTAANLFVNSWAIAGADSGALTQSNLNFVNFGNLIGGSAFDVFTLNNGSTLSGTINGSGGTNFLIRTDGNNTWALNSAHAGTLTGTGGFSNIQNLTGGSGIDTLTAVDQSNDWKITGLDAGSVQQNVVTPTDTVTFSLMENLTGGTNADAFVFTTSASNVSGLLDGNIGSDSLDITALTTVRTVQIGNTANINLNINNFETVSANAGLANTLINNNTANNNWNINLLNGGILNSALSFSGFRNLVGGSMTDDFVFSGTGQLTAGTITGGGGTDSVTGHNTANSWNLNVTNGGILTNGTTTTTLSSIEGFVGGSGVDTLTTSVAGAHNWQITGSGSGTVNDLTTGFSNFENLTGNASVDTFTLNGGTLSGNINGSGGADILNADNVANSWNVTSVNGGTVTGVGSFTNIENLNGNNGIDNFTLAGGIVSGAIDGGMGANSLQARNAANSWNINNPDAGSVTGIAGGFSNIQTLTGGTSTDSFVFSALGNITGLLDGNNGTDSLNIAALPSTTVQVGNAVNGNLNIIGIESIIANSTANNILMADNQVNAWQVTGTNSGSLNGMNFSGFKRLLGNGLSDNFVFQNGWSVDNGIDAMAGIDVADGSAIIGAVVFQIGAAGFDNFESFIGNNSNSTLIADSVANTWQLTGNNSGTVGAISFQGFDKLTGGDQVDVFNVTGNGTLDGLANGGIGDDVANITLSGVESGGFGFNGGAGTDTVNLTGGNANYQGQYNSAVAGFEQLSYDQAGNSYAVNYTQSETINANLSSANLTVNGTTSADTIDLGTDTFIVNTATLVNHNGNTNLTIDGLAGIDTVTAASTISTNTLLISNVNMVGSSGSTLNTNISQLNLSNVTGDVFINELNAINIGQLDNLAGNLTLNNQSGDIQDVAVLTTNANLSFTAQTGNIQLDNDNQLGGELSLVAANGNVTLNNTQATQLAAISAQNLTISSNGSITDTATSLINVTSSTVLMAAGSDITLDGSNQVFTSVEVSSAANLTLADSNASGLTIAAINVTGDARVTSTGSLSTNQIVAGGLVSLTTDGSVNDSNGGANNVTATTLEIVAVSGIGNGNALETQVGTMDITNTGSGNIDLAQTGTIDLVGLKNTGSSGNIILNANANIRFNPGSVVANRSVGDLVMRTTGGNFVGLGIGSLANPDITAQNATFIGRSGTFGSFMRKLTLDVPGSVLIDTRASFNPQFVPPGPASLEVGGIDLSLLGSISLANELLVEVESLGEVDEAIFTNLQNYAAQDVSILMPQDQRFDDEEEESEPLSLLHQ